MVHFRQDAYRELKQHLGQRKPFHCYVDPRKPQQAVLYRNVRGEMLAFNTVFATLFGSVGLGLIIGALVAARRLPRENAIDSGRSAVARARRLGGGAHSRKRRRAGGADHGGCRSVLEHRVVAARWTNFPRYGEQPGNVEVGAARVSGDWRFAGRRVAYQFIRSQKFGESMLQFASTPGVVGGQLAGVVHIPKLITADEGFRLRLNCFG